MKNNSTARLPIPHNRPVELIAMPRENLAAVIAVIDVVCTVAKVQDATSQLLLETLEDLLDVYNRRKPVTAYFRPRRIRP